ncbi:MAG: methionyl-tRNA formyltransferase [Planctomycetota bacterium]
MPRICFSGTPQIAADHLVRMIAAGFVPGLVISQPDRPAGRGRQLHMPEVKQLALEHGIEVWQPERIRQRAVIDQFVERQFDVHIVVAYGQILAERMFDAPARGTFNSHASLLPRWRGSAPIEWALIAGDTITGVALQRVVRGLDEGPIVAQRELPIGPDDDRAMLYERLGRLGGELLTDTLPAIIAGTHTETPQAAEGVTYAERLTAAHGQLDLTQSAAQLHNRIRALHPHPGSRVTAVLEGDVRQSLKLVEAVAAAWPAELPTPDVVPAPGTLLRAAHRLLVATGDGLLEIIQCQPDGKKAMPADAWCNGHKPVRFE